MTEEFTITLCVCPKCGDERSTIHKYCTRCGTQLIATGLFIKVKDGEIKEVRLTK